MLKTFTLDKIDNTVITPSQGKMEFHITDENGLQRMVWGKTTLDENQHVVAITAIKKREHPLIQCLLHAELNETIKIEFTQYNDVFERKEDDGKTPTVEELMQEMQKKPLRMGELLEFGEK